MPERPIGDPTRSGQGGLRAQELETLDAEPIDLPLRIGEAERLLREQRVQDDDAEDHRGYERGREHSEAQQVLLPPSLRCNRTVVA